MCDNQTIAEILKDTLNLLYKKNNWTVGVKARNRHCSKHYSPLGDSVPSWSYDACKWSLAGAIERCAIDAEAYKDLLIIYAAINKELNNESIADFNDRASHEEIITLLKKVMKKYSNDS